MIKLRKIRRLFTIHTRFEAWLAIYAIALGAVERGQHYLVQYHGGASGWMLAAACTGVVFVAGAKLLDSVKPRPAIVAGPYSAPTARLLTGNRPRAPRVRPGSESRPWFHTGSRPATGLSDRRAASPEDRTRNPDC
jgi:hypothetical protein